MSLKEYDRKRHFDKTPEPTGGEPRRDGKPIFVVQRHQASRLHFDFRLEVGDTLKSWAVPKGPSMNPSDKRLAVLAEDHPLDYAGFEGTIPEGEYGAGTVEIWDHGTWEPSEKTPDPEKALEAGLLEFTLDGEKLGGAFTLLRLKDPSSENWLLIKKRDDEAIRTRYDANEIPAHG